MKIQLTTVEARIIGCLLEKESTTPDQYPLTLNSLTNACNQKSNREPVMSLSEGEVLEAVDELISKRLISDESSFNSRVSKYQHRFCNTEFGDMQFSQQERGIICCMLLRGAQTPGELRTRTNRLCSFSDVKEVESVLETLAQGDKNNALIVKLPREAGKRESRYMHQFCGTVDPDLLAVTKPATTSSVDNDRLNSLENEVRQLREEMVELKELIERFSKSTYE